MQLCLMTHVLREVLEKTTTAHLWHALCMMKSLANKIRLKERLYTFSTVEGTLIQNYLGDFNSVLIDLYDMDVKIEDEDRTILLYAFQGNCTI